MRLPAKQLIGKTPAEQRAGVLDVIQKRALLAALIVAVCLRLVGISWGLPGAAHSDSYHPDEGTIYGHAANMADTGDLNPHFFNYGSLPIMLSAAILKLSGAYVPQRIAMGLAALRLLSVVAGVVTAWLAAFIAGRLFRGGWAPAIAAFGVAVAPLAVVNSHYATVDALAACLLTASFACAVRILDEDSRRLLVRCSRLRLSCESAMTGQFISLASAFSEREISEISLTRFSTCPPSRINCR